MFRFQDFEVLLSTTGTVLVGAILAFFMEMTEFLLVSFTSSLTLSVSGIVKVKEFDNSKVITDSNILYCGVYRKC